MKILMVCLGNICRSPLAQGIMEHKAAAAGLNWQVDSAGTGEWHRGEPPHRLSIKVAAQNGVDISKQRARTYMPEDMLHFDRIYFMDKNNYQEGQRIAGKLWQPAKAALLLDVLQPHPLQEVPDPYYSTEQAYHEVFNLISDACEAIIEEFKTRNPAA